MLKMLFNDYEGGEEGSVDGALVGVADVREGILGLEEVLVVRGVVTKGDGGWVTGYGTRYIEVEQTVFGRGRAEARLS